MEFSRPLVWDATCRDTFVATYRGLATNGADASSEEKKAKKYAHLGPAYVFHPVAIETSGAVSKSFLRELGTRMHKEA